MSRFGKLAALATVAATISCSNDPTQTRREFVPEMIDSVPYDSFAPNPVTRDGKTQIKPAEGTIARGVTPFHYGPTADEAERAGRELHNPFTATPEVLARGEVVFRTFCTPCHGKMGLGDGPIIPKFPTPPSLVASHARSLADGRIFHIIARGQGVMPAHGVQVFDDDRWKVIVFLRGLQGPANTAPLPSASATGVTL